MFVAFNTNVALDLCCKVFSEIIRGRSPELNFEPILGERPDCSCTCLSLCGRIDMPNAQLCFLWRGPSGSSFELE
jgi:hypothetical protein